MRYAMLIPMLLCVALTGRAVAAQPGEIEATIDLSGVGIIERPGAIVPQDLSFIDEYGDHIMLGDLFMTGKPVVLNLGYYTCPSVCNLVLNGMTDVMKATSLLPGRDYVVISLSIDPSETYKLALAKKSSYLRELGQAQAGKGWHFLTGSEANIKALANAVGYEFKWVPQAREYAHPAAIILLTPDGRVSRYLHGREYAADTFRLSLVEASQGEIGNIVDQLMLICFGYDKDKHKYTFAAVGLMKLGGGVTLITLIAMAIFLFRRERRLHLAADDAVPSIGHTST